MHPASACNHGKIDYPAMARAMGIDPNQAICPLRHHRQEVCDQLHGPLAFSPRTPGSRLLWLDWQQEDDEIPGVNPTWWLNYVYFTDQEREGKRPCCFTGGED